MTSLTKTLHDAQERARAERKQVKLKCAGCGAEVVRGIGEVMRYMVLHRAKLPRVWCSRGCFQAKAGERVWGMRKERG